MTDITTAIVAEARRLEEDTLYSAKGHFEVASLWQRVNVIVGTLATIAAALAAVFTLSHTDAVVITLAILVAISTGTMTYLNPSQIAAAHHESGTAYNAIHNKARVLHTIDCQSSATSDDLASRLKELCHQRDDLAPLKGEKLM